ncbi:unnamed protein product [Lota lota]
MSLVPVDVSGPGGRLWSRRTSLVPADVSLVPADVSLVPADVSLVPADVSLVPVDVSGPLVPVDVSLVRCCDQTGPSGRVSGSQWTCLWSSTVIRLVPVDVSLVQCCDQTGFQCNVTSAKIAFILCLPFMGVHY